MPWQIEVKITIPVRGRDPLIEWRAVRPTHGQPYTYDTREEASAVMRMCYPDETPDTVRLREVQP
jgi:hypothetical protein